MSGKIVSGTLTDSNTGEAISLANIRVTPVGRRGIADAQGKFTIAVDGGDTIVFTSMGYRPLELPVTSLKTSGNRLKMTASTTELAEYIVKPKKQKYTKRDNPAVTLMRHLRNSMKSASPNNRPWHSYDYYQRITLGLNNFDVPENATDRKSLLLRDYADTAVNTGLPVVLMSVKELSGTRIISSSPKTDKKIVKAIRSEGIDEAFNSDNITRILTDVLRESDIADNDITLMQNRFVSPLSTIAADYYRYFITDTIRTGKGKFKRTLVELSFSPKTPESFGFNGRMYADITDSVPYVSEIYMRVPRVINLNYIDNIFIHQTYTLDADHKPVKTLDDMSLELQLLPGTQSFYAHRITGFSGHSNHKRTDMEKYYDQLGNEFVLDANTSQTGLTDWDNLRLVPMSKAEANMGSLLGHLRHMPWFFWTEKILSILVQGYWEPKPGWPVAFGPVNTLVSYNEVEGLRLRVGGLTTANLSRHIFARGYAAYGFHDHKWKYLGELEYSFPAKKNHAREFPVHSIRIAHRYDIDMLGQHYLFTNADNVFLSIKRKQSMLAAYKRTSEAEYRLELNNNFSVSAGLRHEILESTPWVPFIDGNGTKKSRLHQGYFYAALRYAPGEKFIQGKTSRSPINMDAPIFQLTHEYGPRGFLGSDRCLNRTEASAFKRFWFSAFGYADVMLKGGIVWSSVQYPYLLWPNANLSYTIQPESYSLMNPMEFANDWYGSLDLTYWINGAIFNRIPLIKKLKLREIFTFKLLKGGLRRPNNPEYDNDLFRFPSGSDTHVMGKTPYMEIGCGIDNILTILRIDYVWRLTYRNIPDTDKSGLRIALHFQF